ncbi:Exocyst complex component 1-like protein [Cladobotryum mycophilum]|uniref:Exocyst complex component 1-like protein n=1 Tax=Cladobotryum mycophilum TaxID=491253 RepID=A0ABR0S7E8_9HYPO
MDRANGAGANAAASRAERFEDEKRRIIESCFSKKDVDGSLQETYITHIRITEFSTHPTSPPPPQARGPESEKPRVIIVAVRKSGRVRVHKTKENVSGTFSIGKTWNLDDLTHIESYTGAPVGSNLREWGGETGFLFFIASLVKIYGKYTGGKTPELSGFDQKELDQVLGAGKRPTGASSSKSAIDSGPNQQSTASLASPASTTPSGGADVLRYPRVPPIRPPQNDTNSPAGSFDSTTSRERPVPRWTTQNNKSQDSLAARSEDASSLPPRSRNGMAGPGVAGRFGESRDARESSQEPLPPLSRQQQESKLPPERRRPPMDPSRPQDRDLVPPPLMSSGARREPMAPPPRSTDRLTPQMMPAVLQPGGGLLGETVSPDFPLPAAESLENSRPPSVKTELVSDTKASAAIPSSEVSIPNFEAASDVTLNEQTIVGGLGGGLRPGLGPMIKAKKSKNDIAGAIWKAASAASAFRPRPGGAGDRLRQAHTKFDDGPDGITSVVPAPPRPASRETTPVHDPIKSTEAVPEVKITVPNSSRPTSLHGPIGEIKKAPDASKASQEEVPRRSITIGQDTKYLQTLGVEPIILDDRSEEFCKWLDFFGWVPGEPMQSRNTDDMKNDLERELNTAQAGGWLARFREEDERVNAIKRGIDLAMAECEELDNLLTLYSVELSTLSDDIAYIEAQGQGLQVQTANQKLLKKELESLLETCAITSSDLQALQLAPLETLQGLEDVESALVTLFKAMIKIDPSIGEGEPGKAVDVSLDSDQSLGLNSDYGNMRIVQEKKEMYLQESTHFMQRLLVYMTKQFEEAYIETKQALDGALSKKVDPAHHDVGRDMLWKYGPLMLYARDADLENWNRLIQVYQDKSHPVYKHEFQNVVAIWRKNARKLTGEEAELLFSHQVEKQQEGVATTARKLTVKRSQTLARALRSPLADGGSRTLVDKSATDTRSLPYEVFSGVLDDLLPLVEMEQNFVIDFFHATTLEQMDFPDAVAACAPRGRRGGDLKRHRLMEPDRELARRVNRSMEVIFSFLELELQRLMEWVTAQDPLQGVGVLATLERKLAEMGQSNQDFLNTVLQKLHGVLEGRFRKFVDEQIRAIEETKVKINKRKGVISFFRVFPTFMSAVENMLVGIEQHHVLRRTVDREYDRILKTMFDSLMVIAREHPAVGVATGAGDPEDKEALNFHILLIENMNHFLEETDTRGLEVLEEWKEQANTEYHEHMGLYLNAVMRRPLGKLLDHLENIEAQLQTGKSAMTIARQPSNSKAIFSKILGSYDSKEVRKGIEALRKRVEKHFGDADDPTLSRGLVVKVSKECEEFYADVEGRIGRVTTDVYGGDVPFEWPRVDVKAAFR